MRRRDAFGAPGDLLPDREEDEGNDDMWRRDRRQFSGWGDRGQL